MILRYSINITKRFLQLSKLITLITGGIESMKQIIPFLLLIMLLSGCSSASSKDYRQITMDEAVSMMETEKDYLIVDVRTQKEYDQAHIPGAICIPNESIGSDELSQLPKKDQLIFVYCRSGNRSKLASAKLADLGYTNIIEMGGIIHWPKDTEKTMP